MAGRTSGQIKEIQQRTASRFEHALELLYHLRNDFVMPRLVGSRSKLVIRQPHNVAFRLSVLYSSLHRLVVKMTGHDLTTDATRQLAQQYCQNVEAMILAAKAKGMTPVLVKQAIDMTFISRRDGWYQVLGESIDQTLKASDTLGAKHGVPVIDAATPLLTQKNPLERKVWFYDDVHLTDEGNRVLAKLVAGALVRLYPHWFQGRHKMAASR